MKWYVQALLYSVNFSNLGGKGQLTSISKIKQYSDKIKYLL